MTDTRITPESTGNDVAAAVRAGDENAFTAHVDRHRRELHVHCYRMLGSFDDAEDAVQETFLRAWRYRSSLKEDAPLRPWLYRIATNVCNDAIARDRRRSALVDEDGGTASGRVPDVAWLQPYPDRLLEAVAPREAEPDARVVTRESIELAFLAVIQLLTPHQRAALILRDVLGWSAKETADLLEVSVAAANGALQRARTTLRAHLPARGTAPADASKGERALLRRYIEASEKAEPAAFTELIHEEAVFLMPPEPGITVGRDAMIRFWQEGGFGTPALGRLRCIETRANRQPAVANYVRRDGEPGWRALALDVLRIEDGLITEIVAFPPDVFPAFDLPDTLPADD